MIDMKKIILFWGCGVKNKTILDEYYLKPFEECDPDNFWKFGWNFIQNSKTLSDEWMDRYWM